MNTASLSLLDRLKGAGPDGPYWLRLKDVYLPLIRSWLAGIPGLHDNADDLEDVFIVLLRGLPAFERCRHGSFRVRFVEESIYRP